MPADKSKRGSDGADGRPGSELSLAERYPSVEEDAMTSYGLLGRLAYKASYGISFGLVYPVALAARIVPRDNALVYGLHDGAVAARDEATALWNRRAAGSGAEPIIQPS